MARKKIDYSQNLLDMGIGLSNEICNKSKSVSKTNRLEKKFKLNISNKSQKSIYFELCKNNFEAFCKYYLPKYFTHKFAPYQNAIMSILNNRFVSIKDYSTIKDNLMRKENEEYLRVNKYINGIIDCEPRNFGKSVRLSFAYPLWCLLYAKEQFILTFTSNKSMATQIISAIKNELLDNISILADFGETVLKANSNQIELKNGSMLYSVGYGSGVRGIRNKQHRPSLIILDDVSDIKNNTNSQLREKLYRWFKSTVLPLSKDGFIIMVNTILNNEDLPSTLLKEIKSGMFEDFIGIKLGCYDSQGYSIWESRWSCQELKKKEKELGYRAFTTELLNEPPNGSMIDKTWIKQYNKLDLLTCTEQPQYYMGIDPSAGSHDRSSIVISQKQNDTIYVVDTYNETVSPKKFIEVVFDYYTKYNPKKSYIENNGFQETLRTMIVDYGLSKNVKINISGIKATTSKANRLNELLFLIENGKIMFKNTSDELVYQLMDFPNGSYDDLVDALVYSVKASEVEQMVFSIT